jgi:hypothetical protein
MISRNRAELDIDEQAMNEAILNRAGQGPDSSTWLAK